MASHKVEERGEQLEKAKEAMVRGLPPRGVILASGDDFRTREFSTAELEAAVKREVAPESDPVRPPLRTSSRPPQPQL